MIEGAVLEAVETPRLEAAEVLAKEEQSRVEQVGTEIRQHSEFLISPRRKAHITRCPISVEKPDQVDRSQHAGIQQLLQPHYVRLKAVVVRRVAGHTGRAAQLLQAIEQLFVLRQQGFFNENVLAVAEQVLQEANLHLVWRADQSGVETLQGNLLNRVILGLGVYRIDRRNDIRLGNRQPLGPLYPETDDDHHHEYLTCFSTAFSFFRTSSGATGLFPSCSHATAAAIEPRIDAITPDFVATKANVA